MLWYVVIDFTNDVDGELSVLRCDYGEPEGVMDGPFTTEREAWHTLFILSGEREECVVV